jgi:hypothetical protein
VAGCFQLYAEFNRAALSVLGAQKQIVINAKAKFY